MVAVSVVVGVAVAGTGGWVLAMFARPRVGFGPRAGQPVQAGTDLPPLRLKGVVTAGERVSPPAGS